MSPRPEPLDFFWFRGDPDARTWRCARAQVIVRTCASLGYARLVAIDEALAARVRTILSGRTHLEEKRMMGRLAFLVDGTMCCTVGTDGLLVRVTKADRERWLALPHVQPMTMGTRTMSGFVRVESAGLRTAASLRAWVTRGLSAAATRVK